MKQILVKALFLSLISSFAWGNCQQTMHVDFASQQDGIISDYQFDYDCGSLILSGGLIDQDGWKIEPQSTATFTHNLVHHDDEYFAFRLGIQRTIDTDSPLLISYFDDQDTLLYQLDTYLTKDTKTFFDAYQPDLVKITIENKSETAQIFVASIGIFPDFNRQEVALCDTGRFEWLTLLILLLAFRIRRVKA